MTFDLWIWVDEGVDIAGRRWCGEFAPAAHHFKNRPITDFAIAQHTKRANIDQYLFLPGVHTPTTRAAQSHADQRLRVSAIHCPTIRQYHIRTQQAICLAY